LASKEWWVWCKTYRFNKFYRFFHSHFTDAEHGPVAKDRQNNRILSTKNDRILSAEAKGVFCFSAKSASALSAMHARPEADFCPKWFKASEQPLNVTIDFIRHGNSILSRRGKNLFWFSSKHSV
jgi:hypothetical protein